MPEHSLAIWMILGILAFAGTAGFLHLIASLVRNETFVHDLKIRVAELQVEILEKTKADLARDALDNSDVELVD